ncbi:MAG: 50S ribosomal protein L24 [Acidobacteriia bacterium]|nr:50S ribosomal protein L24 [Terriglobia bacterium]MYC66679.1 50S ribosomal protein L24 [Terriglobia bacterium]
MPKMRRHRKPLVMYKTKVKKNDTVEVITGRSKGLRGRVLQVDRKRGRLLVEGANMVRKHVRPNPQKQVKGGIAERESMMDLSNVRVVTE